MPAPAATTDRNMLATLAHQHPKTHAELAGSGAARCRPHRGHRAGAAGVGRAPRACGLPSASSGALPPPAASRPPARAVWAQRGHAHRCAPAAVGAACCVRANRSEPPLFARATSGQLSANTFASRRPSSQPAGGQMSPQADRRSVMQNCFGPTNRASADAQCSDATCCFAPLAVVCCKSMLSAVVALGTKRAKQTKAKQSKAPPCR